MRSAMSSGVDMRRAPLLASAAARSSSTLLPVAAERCANISSCRSVRVLPGWITLTLTPSRMPSFDSPLAKLAAAALTELPTRNVGSGARAAPPTTQTTWPCAALSIGQNRRESRTAAKYFSANPSMKASSGSSRKLPARVRPALLTTTRLSFACGFIHWKLFTVPSTVL